MHKCGHLQRGTLLLKLELDGLHFIHALIYIEEDKLEGAAKCKMQGVVAGLEAVWKGKAVGAV